MKHPSPDEVKALRKRHNLTQSQAADLIYVTKNAWQKYETSTENNSSRLMHPAFWELFQIKCTLYAFDGRD